MKITMNIKMMIISKMVEMVVLIEEEEVDTEVEEATEEEVDLEVVEEVEEVVAAVEDEACKEATSVEAA